MVWRGVQKATKSAYVIYEWSPSVHKYLILMFKEVSNLQNIQYYFFIHIFCYGETKSKGIKTEGL